MVHASASHVQHEERGADATLNRRRIVHIASKSAHDRKPTRQACKPFSAVPHLTPSLERREDEKS